MIPRLEFAAARRGVLDRAEGVVRPVVAEALSHYGQRLWANPIMVVASDLFRQMVQEEGGSARANSTPYREVLAASLARLSEPDDTTVDRLTTMVATSAVNAATSVVAEQDGNLIEWVSMEDNDVRASHREADGQQIVAGATFEVDGEKLHYPGEPVGDPAVWINCRCVVRPALGGEMSTNLTIPGGEALVAALYAAAAEVDADEVDPDAPEVPDEADGIDVPWYGVLAPEGVATGDKRKFAEGSLRYRDLPLPLRWQEVDQPGHDGSVVVGRIDRIWLENGLHKAEGVFAQNAAAEKVIDLMAGRHLRGVSVDLDDTSVEMQNDQGERWEFDEDDPEYVPTMVVTDGRIASAALCSIPAFQEAFVSIGTWDTAADQPHEVPSLAADGTEQEDETVTGNTVAAVGQVTVGGVVIGEGGSITVGADGTSTFTNVTFAPGTHDGPGWITHPKATARIRRYWVRGKGAAKIRWGEPNDFYRCRRQLAKYVQNPKWLSGLCANMHKEALGIWPGEHGEKIAASTEVAGFNQVEACTDCMDALVSSAASRRPGQWYVDPELAGPTPITVTDDGRIYGHLATWGTCHIGMKGACVTPPKSHADYGYFRTGIVRTDLGDVAVGQITMGTGHADIRAGHNAAVAHYDHTGMVVADVAAGEDEFGIWVAGGLRPDLDDEEIAGLAAAALSGDWRSISGHLELVAALCVNVPGFPIPRVALAASGFDQTALVAAGVVEQDDKPEATAITVTAPTALDVAEFARQVVLAMDRETERRTRLDSFRATLREQGLERLRLSMKGSE